MILAAVTLALAVSQPVLTVRTEPIAQSQSIPRGAQRVAMLRARFTASCTSAVPVHSVTLLHEGAGEATELARVYAVEGVLRMSRAAVPAARDGQVTVRLRSFTVPACGTRTLTFVADTDPHAVAGGEHRLVLARTEDIETGDAALRVRLEQGRGGPMNSPVLRAVGPVRGSLSVAYLSVPQPVTYGAKRVVLRIKLSADRLDDHRVTAITLTNEGKARGEHLQRLFLAGTSGEALTDIVPALDGDRVRFTFDPPLRVGKNQHRVLALHADVRGRRRDTMEFVVQEPGDIEAELQRGRTTSTP